LQSLSLPVTKLSGAEERGCPKDAQRGAVPVARPLQEPRVGSADLAPGPEEGCSHLVSALARTRPWDGASRACVRLPLSHHYTPLGKAPLHPSCRPLQALAAALRRGPSAWGLLPEAAGRCGRRETAREEAASPARNGTWFCTAAFAYRPERAEGKESYCCSLLLARAVICWGPRLLPVG